MSLGKYSKAIIAVVGAIVSFLVSFYGQTDWVNALVLALTALGVYQVPNQ